MDNSSSKMKPCHSPFTHPFPLSRQSPLQEEDRPSNDNEASISRPTKARSASIDKWSSAARRSSTSSRRKNSYSLCLTSSSGSNSIQGATSITSHELSGAERLLGVGLGLAIRTDLLTVSNGRGCWSGVLSSDHWLFRHIDSRGQHTQPRWGLV